MQAITGEPAAAWNARIARTATPQTRLMPAPHVLTALTTDPCPAPRQPVQSTPTSQSCVPFAADVHHMQYCALLPLLCALVCACAHVFVRVCGGHVFFRCLALYRSQFQSLCPHETPLCLHWFCFCRVVGARTVLTASSRASGCLKTSTAVRLAPSCDHGDAGGDDADNDNHNGFCCEMVLTPTKITSIDKRI